MWEDSKDKKGKEICKIHISKFKAYVDQPFKVLFDESMNELVESICKNGVLFPVIARQLVDGFYEIISGHRRIEACRLARVVKIPTIVRTLDDDDAAIMLVDRNLQKENILPSEKAYAYKLKMEALNRQGQRTDLTSDQIGQKLKKGSRDIIAEQSGDSAVQVSRYIRLTNLVYQLLDMVDRSAIPMNAAVELSYLGTKAQTDIAEILQRDEMPLSLNQAKRIRAISKDGKISTDAILAILTETVPEKINVTLKEEKIRQYFPTEYTKSQIEDIVLDLIKNGITSRERRENERNLYIL